MLGKVDIIFPSAQNVLGEKINCVTKKNEYTVFSYKYLSVKHANSSKCEIEFIYLGVIF